MVSMARDAAPATLPATLPTVRGPSADVAGSPHEDPRTGEVTIGYQPHHVPGNGEWAYLAAEIRRGGGTLFWELFSGVAVLTAAFSEEGWVVGPPVDVLTSPSMNLLDPIFCMLVLGLILEGHITVLHGGSETCPTSRPDQSQPICAIDQ